MKASAFTAVVGEMDVLNLVAKVDSGVGLEIADKFGAVEFVWRYVEVDVSGDGLAFPFDLGVPDGAEEIELDPVVAAFMAPAGASTASLALGPLPARVESGQIVVDLPPDRQVRALHLAKLATAGEDSVALSGEGDLAGRRLSVTVFDKAKGAWGSAVVAVPPIPRRGQTAPTLTGGSFAAGVLRLPPLATTKVRITLVDGDSPDEFSAVAVSVGSVTGWALPIPRDLKLLGPDKAELWAFPGDLSPELDVVETDLTAGLATFLEAKRAAGERLSGTLTLRAAFPCKVQMQRPQVAGALVRGAPGTVAVELAGAPAPFAWPGPPLGSAPPTAVVADIGVRYAGLRLAEVSDALPTTEAVRGSVVGPVPVARALPPLALRDEALGRIGLVGRCPEDSDLLVSVVPAVEPGPPLASATVAVRASNRLTVVWAELAQPLTVDRPIAIEVSAGRGRFLWAGEDAPLVRLAVVDPDPGGRPILIGGAPLLTLSTPELFVARAAVPAAAFSGTGPALASALFCTVELTDTELRWRRGGS